MTGVMLIPAYTPPLPDDAHLTLVYAGEDDETDTHTLARLTWQARHYASQHKAFPARVVGPNFHFGDSHDEPVLLIHLTPEIALMRSGVEQFSRSEYTEFRPHVSVPALRGLPSRHLPKTLYFNRISVWNSHAKVDYWLGA